MSYIDLSLRDYADEVSTKAMPGGGSVAALAGALGVSLLIKTLLLSHKRIPRELFMLKAKLLSLIDEDVQRFKRGPKDATRTLVELCKISNKALSLSQKILKNSKPILKGDFMMGAGLLIAAFRSASLNIEINSKYIKDKKFTNDTVKIIKRLSREVTIWQRRY